MNSSWFKLVLRANKVKVGKGVLLKGIPVIIRTRGAKLSIGNNVTIKSSFLSNLVGLFSRTIIVARIPGAVVNISDNVGISGATIYARKRIDIGQGTLIGGNVKIFDNDFHPIEAEARIANNTAMIGTKPVLIGKNCFIGANALILKGTVLGDRCVVGAGAVVSGKFGQGSVIVGNPGKVVKRV